MAHPGMPDSLPGGDDPSGMPPRPFPGERPLGADEPSAPYEETSPDEPLEPGIGPERPPGGADSTGTTRLSAFPQTYEALAIQEAIESGMARRELLETLGGLRMTEFIPPHAGEPGADYAARATGELMVRYLAKDEDDRVPPV